jgi:hypothetical protein
MKTIVMNLFIGLALTATAGVIKAQLTEKKVLTLEGAKRVIDAAKAFVSTKTTNLTYS